MGMTEVELTVKNLENSDLQVTDMFLVDSGAGFTVLPANMVKKLKIKPVYEKEFVLADGKIVKRKIGNAWINFQGKQMASPVVLGEKNDSKLLGVLTLEAYGLALDPFERKLYPAKLML